MTSAAPAPARWRILNADGSWFDTENELVREEDGSITILGPHDSVRGVKRPVEVRRLA